VVGFATGRRKDAVVRLALGGMNALHFLLFLPKVGRAFNLLDAAVENIVFFLVWPFASPRLFLHGIVGIL
jgi:hypothetical protein